MIVVISYSLESIERNGALKLKGLQDEARKNNYQIIGLTASGTDAKKRINEAYNLDFEWYLCDEKALKTVVRSNPGVLELGTGTVKQKVHWNDIEDLELPEVEKVLSVKSDLVNAPIFIDGKLSTLEEFNDLNKDDIKNLYFYKDKAPVEEFNKKNNTSFDNIIKVELKNSKNDIAYFINGESSTKGAVEALDKDKIESVNVIKDSIQLKELNTKNHAFYKGIIQVKLKDE